MSGEKIVRPFQSPDVFTARVLAPEQTSVVQKPEEATLVWEGSAAAEYIEEPPPIVMGFTTVWEEDRSRRVTESVRVENPDDSSQFVEIERITSTVFKNKLSGEELPLKLDWS